MATVIELRNSKPPETLQTPTLQRIAGMIETCRVEGDMGLLLGVPGIGKTTAIEHYVAQPTRDPNGEITNYRCKILVTASEVNGANARLFTNAVLSGLTTPGGYWSGGDYAYAHQGFEELVRQLSELHTPTVIIIDEAQKLNSKNLEILRQLHDMTGVGVVICANPRFQDRFNKSRNADFAQLDSRLGYRLKFDQILPRDDLQVICEAWGVTDTDAIGELANQSSGIGGLRRAVKLLQRTKHMAGNGQVRAKHIKDAAVIMGIAR